MSDLRTGLFSFYASQAGLDKERMERFNLVLAAHLVIVVNQKADPRGPKYTVTTKSSLRVERATCKSRQG